MATAQASPQVSEEYLTELGERGQAIYEKLKAQLEPEFNGQHIVIHCRYGRLCDSEIADTGDSCHVAPLSG